LYYIIYYNYLAAKIDEIFIISNTFLEKSQIFPLKKKNSPPQATFFYKKSLCKIKRGIKSKNKVADI